MSRLLLRAATLGCLALAALLLAIDAREYPQLSRAGLTALVRGTLPLLAAGALNLRALAGGRGWPCAALGADLLLLGWSVRPLGAHPAPFFWMRAAVALLLVLGSVASIRWPGGVHDERRP